MPYVVVAFSLICMYLLLLGIRICFMRRLYVQVTYTFASCTDSKACASSRSSQDEG